MKKMILIDSNCLLVLLLGMIDPNLIDTHSKTSIYEKKDFYDLMSFIGDIKSLVVLPNIFTEVDNLLNKNFKGNQKYLYIKSIIELMLNSKEEYLKSVLIRDKTSFYDLGLTDSLILELAKQNNLLITDDSQLSDYARANSIEVYDMKYLRNQRFF